MGLFLTLLYIVVHYLSPPELFPAVAPFRPQLITVIVAGLATVFLLPVYGYPVKLPQNLLAVGLFGAVLMSRLAQMWLGGVLMALYEFGPIICVFFLLAANVTSLGRLKMCMLVFCGVGFYYCIVGGLAMNGMGSPKFLYEQQMIGGGIIYRMRGLGSINDPNDLAQVLLVSIALLSAFWTKQTKMRNTLLLTPLMALLIYGISQTRSRGAMLTLVIMMMVWLSRKVNVIAGGMMAAAALVLLLAINFTGGRGMVSDDGRIMAWSAAITMFKTHPLFGVGFNGFLENHDLATHNSFLLCLAELGTLGFFCWMGLTIVTMMHINQLIAKCTGRPELAEVLRLALSIRLALVGFLFSSWFLSRTYTVTFYMLVALAACLTYLAERKLPRAYPFQWPPFQRWGWFTFVSQPITLALAYVLIRVQII
ncbi:MAG: hypothetical protein IT162_12400 [Bryobacterales bacterium]|nr:hypothetical protein [Bryobacterales bacterium]